MGARGAGVTWPLSRTQGIYDWARDKDDRARDKDEQTGLRENAHLRRGGGGRHEGYLEACGITSGHLSSDFDIACHLTKSPRPKSVTCLQAESRVWDTTNTWAPSRTLRICGVPAVRVVALAVLEKNEHYSVWIATPSKVASTENSTSDNQQQQGSGLVLSEYHGNSLGSH